MKIAPRFVRWIVIPATALLVLAAAAVYVVTRTRPGVERAGRYLVERIGQSLHGHLSVGDITSRRLLSGAVLDDVTITMPDGRTFLRADSIRLRYSWLRLLRGQIAFDGVDLYRPDVTLEMLPGDSSWNYDRLFGTAPKSGKPADKGRSTIVLEEARIHQGRLVIREPWKPQPGQDTSRLILESVPGGRVRTLRFDDIEATLPQALIESPSVEGRRFRFDGLSARVGIWRQPIPVRDLRGTVEVNDSVIGFAIRDVALPASHTAVRGRITVGRRGERYDLQFVNADLAFQDFHWLFPRLPQQGRAQLDLTLATRPGGHLSLVARNLRLRSGASRVSGTFGLLVGEPLRFTSVALQLASVDVGLVQRILGRDLPVRGAVTGEIALDGPMTDLQTHGNARLERAGRSDPEAAASWTGAVRLGQPLGASDLRVQVQRLDLGLVSRVAPGVTMPGVLDGHLHLDGRLDRALAVDGELHQPVAGDRSTSIAVNGTVVRARGQMRLDARLNLAPVDLPSLAAQFPQLQGVQGQARGTITVRGPLDDLALGADLTTQAGGLKVDGRLDRTGARLRYAATGSVTGLKPQELFPASPEGNLSGRFQLQGVGTTAETARGSVSLELAGARLRDLNIGAVSVHLTVDSGLVHVDTLFARAAFGTLDARGSFGIAKGMRGSAEVQLVADSLAALRSFVQADSVLNPTAPPTVEGRLRLNATLSGTLDRFDAQGVVHAARFRLRDIAADTADGRFTARDLRTADQALDVHLNAKGLRGYGRTFSDVAVSARYQDMAGSATIQAQAPGGATIRTVGDYAVQDSAVRIVLDTLAFQVGAQPWRLLMPAHIRIAHDGLQMDSVSLARDGGGSLRMAGSLPWKANLAGDTVRLPADFAMEAQHLRLGEFLRLAQSDTVLDGIVDGRLAIRGSARTPQMDGRFSVQQFRFQNSDLDSLQARVSYAARSLEAHVRAWKGGTQILTGDGTAPLDLALGDLRQRRLDQPLQVQARVYGMPAGLALGLVGGFRDVQGRLDGQATLTGTSQQPSFAGTLALNDGAATFDALGIRYDRLQGRFEMNGSDTLHVDTRFQTRNGFATARGTVAFKPLGDPGLDLDVHAQNFQAARRRDFQGMASGDLHLAGHYRRPEVTGSLRLTQGTLNMDELWRQTQIVQIQSPFLFEVVDTAFSPAQQNASNGGSPFLDNIRVNADLNVGSDMWLRGQQLNVAVTGDLTVNFDNQTQAIAMTGTLQAVRGTYQFQPGSNQSQPYTQLVVRKQFTIQQGTIEFVGTPGIDPNLNVTGSHEVHTTNGDRLTIQADVTGTLQNPRVQLSSDAQPPISETDLVSYLYFGQPSFALGASQSQLLNLMTGVTSTTLQGWFSTLGLFDYVDVSTPYSLTSAQNRPMTLAEGFRGMVFEAGRYVAPDLFLAGSVRPLATATGQNTQIPVYDLFGLRLEWQFARTWGLEAYWESRFLRQPPSGLDATLLAEQQQILGLSLFREWHY